MSLPPHPPKQPACQPSAAIAACSIPGLTTDRVPLLPLGADKAASERRRKRILELSEAIAEVDMAAELLQKHLTTASSELAARRLLLTTELAGLLNQCSTK